MINTKCRTKNVATHPETFYISLSTKIICKTMFSEQGNEEVLKIDIQCTKLGKLHKI